MSSPPPILAALGALLLTAAAGAGAAETSSPQWIVGLIKDVGVPVAMLVWFALRVERKLDTLAAGQIEATKAMTRVASALEQVDDHLEITGRHRIPPELRGAKPDKDKEAA